MTPSPWLDMKLVTVLTGYDRPDNREAAMDIAQVTGSVTFVTILMPVDIIARLKMMRLEIRTAIARERKFTLKCAPNT